MTKYMHRRRLDQEERKQIYEKTKGRCAYCGAEITMIQMQIDVVEPQAGSESLDNMLPACRSCNHHKKRGGLESFRKTLEKLPRVLANDNVAYQVALRYGLVILEPHPVRFYFEKIGLEMKPAEKK